MDAKTHKSAAIGGAGLVRWARFLSRQARPALSSGPEAGEAGLRVASELGLVVPSEKAKSIFDLQVAGPKGCDAWLRSWHRWHSLCWGESAGLGIATESDAGGGDGEPGERPPSASSHSNTSAPPGGYDVRRFFGKPRR